MRMGHELDLETPVPMYLPVVPEGNNSEPVSQSS